MKRTRVILFLFTILLSSCTLECYQSWSGSTYKPVEHKFHIDSVYLAKYGLTSANQRINIGTADSWIVDSIPFFHFSIEKKHSNIPIIPIFFVIDHQRKKAKSNLEVIVHNNKNLFQSLDSIYYCITDSSTSVRKAGKFIFGKDFFLNKYQYTPTYQSSYLIEESFQKNDVIIGDFELFCTDTNSKMINFSVKKLKFKNFTRSNYFYTVFD